MIRIRFYNVFNLKEKICISDKDAYMVNEKKQKKERGRKRILELYLFIYLNQIKK